MDKKTARYCVICSLGAFLGAIALPRLWGIAIGGLFLPTGSWLFILVLTSALSFLLGSLLWLSIPNRIRQALDNFTLQMSLRIETIEGRLGDHLSELILNFEQRLRDQDGGAIEGQEVLMAEFVVFFLGMAIAETHLAAGQCKVCGGKHPKASDLEPGDPALYSFDAHVKLKDGRACPIPFLYKLAQDRSSAQSRISKRN